jgi:hypothetical protein
MILPKVLVVLVVLDFITTFYSVQYLGFKEGNYLISQFPIEIVGLCKVIVAISALILSLRLEKYIGKKVELLFIVPVVVYYYVVLNNVLLILEEIFH